MNSTFMMHCGGRPVGFEDPALSFVPEKTETYEPVPFSELILNTKRVCDDFVRVQQYLYVTIWHLLVKLLT